MKPLRKIMVLSAFITGMAAMPCLMAADEQPAAQSAPAAEAQPASQSQLPDLSMEAKAPQTAQESLKRDAVCTRCHDESETTPILAIYQTKHGFRGDMRTPNCQTCHGESANHLKGNVDGKGRPAPDVVFKKHTFPASDDKVRSAQCLTCHKGTNRTNWAGSAHQSNQMACNDCHKIHAKADTVRERATQTEVCYTCHKERRADAHKISTHPIEAGKVVCSDCHNPHGSAGPKLLKKNTVTETCFTCHADKRGPFLFAHQPVTEDCTNCHMPHGSNIAPLLKTRPPFMCQECHDGSHASGTAVGPNAAGYQAGLSTINAAGTGALYPSANNVGNACMNCHRQIHGSNSPAGGYLQR
ncbi:DmsE family decaheme c-type cytochrome [Sideroxydans lithotrophicus]|uniref:Decaheme c-type cytochrome, DmsE family n=1 Tax=Sideroxydans lithotrophicus (strain ES-1) TaxID=580332 RepID=D5CMQ0_SIDLE|nr:DmsE family decaheme c-type cytochrome [Sideroxydans lithotrophicus]ADE12722.1 decaheme c-type cytochrome, DmsE family [Sideroxydans lithotrophicus ES-1]